MNFLDIISQIGFPACVALYALYSSYKHEVFLQDTLSATIKENTDALNELKILIKRLTASNYPPWEDDGK